MGYEPNRGSEPDEREDGHHGYRVQANGLKHQSLLAPGRLLFLNRLSLAMVEIALAPARQGRGTQARLGAFAKNGPAGGRSQGRSYGCVKVL